MTLPVIVAFIGALLSAIGAVWSSINQAAESEQSNKLYKRLAEKSDQIANIQKQLADKGEAMIGIQNKLNEKAEIQNKKTEEIANLNAKLASSQEKIARMSEETANNVTGGDSYCYALLTPKSLDSIQIILYRNGRYPLSDVKISIQRIADAETIGKKLDEIAIDKIFSRLEQITSIIEVDLIPAEEAAYLVGDVPIGMRTGETYKLDFIARNGSWTQYIQYKYDEKGDVKMTSKVRIGKKTVDTPLSNSYVPIYFLNKSHTQ